MAKKSLKIVGIVIGILLLAVIGLLLWLTVTEYKPEAVEVVSVSGFKEKSAPAVGDPLKIVSLNTGYGGLGKESDFFMDGGTGVKPKQSQVLENVGGILSILQEQNADICLLQEVDRDSTRTYKMEQGVAYRTQLERLFFTTSALNYSCDFVPYPWPPIGKVHSGVQTLSGFTIDRAERIALPCPFKWPVSTANLKRCLLVSYVPLENSDKQLVLVNLHLEAYDDGEGKIIQTKMLMEFLTAEYEKGNYVIAGGDFNQTFPGALDAYPIKNTDFWTPGVLESDILPEGWQFAYDLTVPSCRLLNQPYDPESPDTQSYVIDGFILSPNVEVKKVETLDAQFTYTDHNPVILEAALSS